MWTAITVGVFILLVVFLVKTGTMARGMKREHFAELLNGIALRKASSPGFELALGTTPEEARASAIVTSIGVVMAWSVHRDGDVYVHHVSISGRGRSWVFRGVLFAFWLERLGLKGEDTWSARSPTGVDHLRIDVPIAEHQEMWKRALRPVPDSTFRVYIMDLRKLRDTIRRVAWDGSPFAAETPKA